MRGVILIPAGEADGVISTEADGRFTYSASDWRMPTPGEAGANVDFGTDGARAIEIYAVPVVVKPAADMSGALNPLRKIYKWLGFGLIGMGVLLCLTIIGAILGIPLIILGLLALFVLPKIADAGEKSMGKIVDGASR